ncbi:MAG: hypothetical protein ACOY0T_29305 [Myxococcota bacterium]
MTREEFSSSVATGQPPAKLSDELRVLWLDAKGDWEAAHELAQEIESSNGARLHAYLHRKEGDLENARFWYREAGQKEVDTSLEAEWESLVDEFLIFHEN